jgi:hypothetical protein
MKKIPEKTRSRNITEDKCDKYIVNRTREYGKTYYVHGLAEFIL